MQPGTFLSLPCLRLPTVSPSGRTVAYVEQRPDLEADGYVGTVYTRAADGSGRAVARGTFGGAATALAWQDDHTLLLGVDGTVWRLAGENAPERLWQAPGAVGNLSPHPDGEVIAVSVLDGVGDTAAPRRVRVGHHKWDGRGPLREVSESVWLVGGPGGPVRLGDAATAYQRAVWSPDGQHLAAFARRFDEGVNEGRVVLMPTDGAGGDERDLSPVGDILAFAWRRDGAGIVFALRRAPFGSALPFRLHEADLVGRVADWADPGDSLVGPLILCDWRFPAARTPFLVAPDNASVVTLVQEGGAVVARRYHRDGRRENTLGGRGGTISDVTADAAGATFAYAYATHTRIDDLYVCAGSGAPRRLTDAMADWPAAGKVAEPAFFTVTAPDGVESECAFLAPPGASGPVPTVLVVHGGPHGAWGDNLHLEHQVLAHRGIGVLWVNPRGSSGYGADFSGAVVGHWGEGDMSDLMAAVDRAVAEGKADPARLAIMGTSYGGFMSSWVIGHDDRFVTAVVQAPVVNQISMFGTSDIGSFFLRYELGVEGPAVDLETMWDKSPLKYAPNVKASVLLICGENDDRCPIGQSEEYFVALRELGREVEFLRYPGDSHWLSSGGAPSHRLHRQTAVVDWLSERLGVGDPQRETAHGT